LPRAAIILAHLRRRLRPRFRTLIAIGFASILATAAAAEDLPFLGPPGAPAAAFPKPDRPVADIISPIWRDEAARDAVDEPGQVVRLLDIKPGMSVADIGAGSGYYTVRLSPIVGADGRIIAQDVQSDYLQGLSRRVHDLALGNVTIGIGEPHDPRLPAQSIDVAILVHMYHEIVQPYGLLYNLATALKQDARIGIVDLERPTQEHGMPIELLRCELSAVGYREIATHPLAGDGGYLAVFSPPDRAGRRLPGEIVACGGRATGTR
jgi:SAM-dependent methyltransferase